ncbi:MAG: hypothetical protein WC929_00430 [Bacilli bacterium]|jgi:hypothetical protein
MAQANIITKEARQFIIDNCSMTGEKLKQLIKEKYDVDVSVQGVLEHVKVARKNAEEVTQCADAHIAKTISERIEKFLPNIINFYEQDLLRLQKIINGEDPLFDMIDYKDESKTHFDKYWQEKYRKLFCEEAEAYLRMRPPIQTIRIESAIDPDVAAIESWTDEQIEAFEEFKKTLKNNSESL